MNHPGAEPRSITSYEGIIKQGGLLPFDLSIRSSLVVDIVFDSCFVSILSDGIDVESAGPEVSSPEDFFDFWMKSEEFFGGNTLDGLYDD